MIDSDKLQELRDQVGYTFKPDLMKDTVGRFFTRGLFKEMSYMDQDKRNPVMTLKLFDLEEEGLVSFKRVFVDLGDPSGYIPAMVLLGSWDHWLKLCDRHWFRPELARAEDELDIKLRSTAINDIKKIASGGSGSALQAAKYLAEGRCKEKNSTLSKAVGRPKKVDTKVEQDKTAKVVSLQQQETEHDYERLGLGTEDKELIEVDSQRR